MNSSANSTNKLFLKGLTRFAIWRCDKNIRSKNTLLEYESKRDFTKTNEPRSTDDFTKGQKSRFVVQEHHASIFHYDFRLEHNRIMKSWYVLFLEKLSIPKGPSLNPRDRRLAVMVEDHPISYMKFEGKIPDGQYGAGEVRIWDTGTYQLLHHKDINVGIEQGKISFVLYGKKLQGEFLMVRSRSKFNDWFFMKCKDQFANENFVLESILDYSSPRTKTISTTKKWHLIKTE